MDAKDLKLLMEKWDDVINHEAVPEIKGYHKRQVTAILMENQEKFLAESSLSGDIARFEPVLIPIIRRVFPNLIAHEMVAVQPMNMPSGLAFAMRYRYVGDDEPTTGVPSAPADPSSGTRGEPTDNPVILTLADATLFVYGTPVSTTGDAATGVVAYKEGNNVLITTVTGVFAAGDDIDDALTFGAAATTVSAVYTNEAGFNFILEGYSGSYTTAEAEKLRKDMRELGLSVESTPITAKSRALKAQYSVESAQDLKAVHGLDIESELATVLAYEIQQEIDRELIEVIDAQAELNYPVSYDISWDYTTADGRWEQEKFRGLYTRCVAAANQIATATRRGAGNFLIVSSDTATILESLNNFTASPVQEDVNAISIGVAVIGTIGGRFKVIKDTFRTDPNILVGYRGGAVSDVGVVYSPYVPLQMMQAVEPDGFQPRIGFKTRYAITTDFGTEDSRDYYRKVEVAGIDWSAMIAST